jgi:hypothetical protein
VYVNVLGSILKGVEYGYQTISSRANYHTVFNVIKALEISEVTYYRWRKEYGGMTTSQAKRLKELEKENSRLRKAVSDLTLDKLILQEAAKGNF